MPCWNEEVAPFLRVKSQHPHPVARAKRAVAQCFDEICGEMKLRSFRSEEH
jgi:hypothetical protein